MLEQKSNTPTVLVAEDDPSLQSLVKQILQDEGYEVLAAGDGKSALAAARNHPGEIQLLITDLIMPNLDGFDLREQLLRDRPGVPILVMSGALDPEIRGEDFAVIRKPFRPEELSQKVRSILKPAITTVR